MAPVSPVAPVAPVVSPVAPVAPVAPVSPVAPRAPVRARVTRRSCGSRCAGVTGRSRGSRSTGPSPVAPIGPRSRLLHRLHLPGTSCARGTGRAGHTFSAGRAGWTSGAWCAGPTESKLIAVKVPGPPFAKAPLGGEDDYVRIDGTVVEMEGANVGIERYRNVLDNKESLRRE